MRARTNLAILCIGLILATLLIAHNAFCGTDDSGLQVFTLNGADMMGETADVGQEDTKISQYSLNMFQSGNGLCSYPRPKGSGYEWNGVPLMINTGSYCFVKLQNIINSNSCEVYLHTNAIYSSPTGSRTLITSAAYEGADLFNFRGLTKDYLFAGYKLMYSTDSWSTTTEVVLPTASAAVCALWQNRLWLASGYTMYYSAAQDYENFTNSATAGGTTNIFGVSSIIKLVGTRYGLYIFTDKGIFLQNGPSKGWTIEKMSTLTPYNSTTITDFNDVIYFQAGIPNGRKIFAVSGPNVSIATEFPELPYGAYIQSMTVNDSGKLLIISTGYAYSNPAFIFHFENKSWTRSGEHTVNGYGAFFAKVTATGKYAIYFCNRAELFNAQFDGISGYVYPLQWQINTAWMTLDGNSGNRKEIDRMELDHVGGTCSVYLFYAYGNGLYTPAVKTVTTPTNTRTSTYVWNSPIGKTQTNRVFLIFASSGAQTMTRNYVIKQMRIYYRNIGNYKTNSLR